MNCCNTYGKCTQGHDCPARSTPFVPATPACKPKAPPLWMEEPEAPPALTPMDHVYYWVAVTALAAYTVAVVAGIAGYVFGWLS